MFLCFHFCEESESLFHLRLRAEALGSSQDCKDEGGEDVSSHNLNLMSQITPLTFIMLYVAYAIIKI